MERLNSAEAEDFGVTEPPELFPVIVEGAESEVFAAIGEAFEGSQLGTAAKNLILVFQDFGGGVGVTDEHGAALAEVNVDEGAVFFGEVVEGDVGIFAEVVEVAEDGVRARAGGKFEGWFAKAVEGEEEEEEGEKEEEWMG